MKGTDAIGSARGFTLIELMIVVAILGILLAIVLPGYQESVRKSRRADGMRELMELAGRQERFYAQNGEYSDDVEDGLKLGRTASLEGYYSLSVAACGAGIGTCYTLSATPVGAQVKDTKCAVLSVNSLGQKGATGTHPDQCW